MATWESTPADFAINSLTDITIITRNVAISPPQQIVFEAWFHIMNNSGVNRAYVITLDFDGAFDIEFTTGSLVFSSTLMHPFRIRGVLDLRSNSLAYCITMVRGQLAAGIVSGGDTGMLATHLAGKGWGESAADLTAVCTVTLLIRSGNATATQTCYLHNATIEVPSVGSIYTLPAEVDSYAYTGQAASPLYHRLVPANAGSYAYSGVDASLLKICPLAAAPGSYTITGTAADLYYHHSGSAGVGSYTLTGSDAILGRILPLTASAGSYTISGYDAIVGRILILSASADSYIITGYDADLMKIAAPVLVIAEATQLQIADEPALGQHHFLVINEAYQEQAADEPIISAVTLLIIASAVHEQVVTGPSYGTQHHSMSSASILGTLAWLREKKKRE